MSAHRVVLSYKWLRLRPPRGLATFPDGGSPKYTTDVDVLAVVDIPTGALRVLRREPNTKCASDAGHFSVTQTNGSLVLAGRSCLSHESMEWVDEFFILDVDDGTSRNVRYWETLPGGRGGWVVYLASPAGHLVFVTPLPQGTVDTEAGQIWVRAPDGSYHQAARTRHYITIENGEVIYWMAATREFKAFSLTTFATRTLANYREPEFTLAFEAVVVEPARLTYRRRVGETWTSLPLTINTDSLKSAHVWTR